VSTVSASGENLIAAEASVERRFYPRVAPKSLICVGFGEDNSGMLLNVSENGVLVSTPAALRQNFVSRVSLALNGIAKPIEVCVRVVWTTEANHAGLQLLDLSDHDREQVRKWAATEATLTEGASPEWTDALAAEAPAEKRAEDQAKNQVQAEERTEILNWQGQAKVEEDEFVPEPEPLRWAESAAEAHAPEMTLEQLAEERPEVASQVAVAMAPMAAAPAEQPASVRVVVKKKKHSAQGRLAACVAAVLVTLAMGIALKGSPLGVTLAQSFRAVLQKVTAAASRQTQSAAGVQSPSPATTADTDGTSAQGQVAQGNPAPSAAGAVGTASTTAAASKGSNDNKAAAKKSAEGDSKRAAVIAAELPAHADMAPSSALDTPAGQTPEAAATMGAAAVPPTATKSPAAVDDDTQEISSADMKSLEDELAKQPRTTSSDVVPPTPGKSPAGTGANGGAANLNAQPANPNVAPNGATANRPAVAAVNPMTPPDGPKTRVLDVTLPNADVPTFLRLPGEEVFQARGMTMRVQRAVLAPAGHAWWGGARKKVVVLGELRSMVEPQGPRAGDSTRGRVAMTALIGKDGRVTRVMPMNGSEALMPAVLKALREWQFEPTLLDGKRVQTGIYILVDFHPQLENGGRP
jgi:hypothetical protein